MKRLPVCVRRAYVRDVDLRALQAAQVVVLEGVFFGEIVAGVEALHSHGSELVGVALVVPREGVFEHRADHLLRPRGVTPSKTYSRGGGQPIIELKAIQLTSFVVFDRRKQRWVGAAGDPSV